MFQLTDNEMVKLVTICDRFKLLKHSSSLSYAFTEHGVTMLASVLKSDIVLARQNRDFFIPLPLSKKSMIVY